MRRQFVSLAAMWACAVLLTACGSETGSAHGEEAPAPIAIAAEDFAVARQGELERGPVVSGRLTPEEQAIVRAEVGGPVAEASVDVGQAVERNALLARIDGAALRDQLISARSAVASATTALDIARRELERQQTLEEAGAVAMQAVENARRAVTTAEAQLADAQAREALAREQIARTIVRSPIAGIVSERSVNAGDVVQVGAPLFTIVDPSSMRLEGSVPASQLGSIRSGAPVHFEVTGYPDREFKGAVSRISPTADPATGQVQVFISLPNTEGALVGGLFARGRIGAQTASGIIVPEAAIGEPDGQALVAVVRDGIVATLPVAIGLRDPLTERVLVKSGLNPGDVVLLGAARDLTPGTPVRITGTAAEE